MKLLVTGGAGFIGSNFVRYWIEQHPSGPTRSIKTLLAAYHDVPKVLDRLNEDLGRLAVRLDVPFVDAPLSVDWHADDFVDDGHFNAVGARKFAAALAGPIACHCGP